MFCQKCHPFVAPDDADIPWEKNWPPWLLTVTKMVTARHDWAVTWAVIELWPSRDHTEDAVIELWPRRDLAVTELWPSRDWAVTSPSRDWAVIIGPGAVTTVVTVSSRWQFFSQLFCLRCNFVSISILENRGDTSLDPTFKILFRITKPTFGKSFQGPWLHDLKKHAKLRWIIEQIFHDGYHPTRVNRQPILKEIEP